MHKGWKWFPHCVVRGGSRLRTLLHPAASFLEVCELPTPLLHSLGNVQWIQNLMTIGKNWRIPWLQNLHLFTQRWYYYINKKKGDTVLSASGGSVLRSWSYLAPSRGRDFWFLLKFQLWGGEEMLLLTPSETACPTQEGASSGYALVTGKWWHAEVPSTKW